MTYSKVITDAVRSLTSEYAAALYTQGVVAGRFPDVSSMLEQAKKEMAAWLRCMADVYDPPPHQ